MKTYVVAAGSARLADEMVVVALILFILDRTASPALGALVVASYTFPSIFSGPLLGAWLDRTNRPARLIALAQVVFTVSMLLLPAVAEESNVVVMVGLGAIIGLTLPMTSGGFTSMLPRLVREEELSQATSLDALLYSGTAISGPAVAGAVSAVFGSAAAMVSISALAAVSAVSTLFIGLRPRQAPEISDRSALLSGLRNGLRHLMVTPRLLGPTLTTVVSFGAVGLLATALPLHMTSLGVSTASAGAAWTALEIGCFTSVLVLKRRPTKWLPERTVITSVFLHGITMAVWPLSSNLPQLLVLALISGLVSGPTLASIIAARQRYTASGLLGTISTTGASLKIGAYAAGASAGGLLVPRTSTSSILLLIATLHLFAAAVGWLVTSRGTRPEPWSA